MHFFVIVCKTVTFSSDAELQTQQINLLKSPFRQ